MKKHPASLAFYSVCIFFIFILLLTLPGSPAAASTLPQAAAGLQIEVEAGLDGFCKFNHWLPVRVTIENNGPNLDGDLVAVSSNGQQDWEYAAQLSMPAVSRKEVTLFVFPIDREETVLVEYREGGKNVLISDLATVNCLPEEDNLFGVWAENPSIFNTLTTVDPPNGRSSLAQLEPEDFPEHFQGFAPLDFIAISDVDTGLLSPKQIEALRIWVANGGQLIVAGGAGWRKTAAGIEDFLPLLPTGTSTLPGLPNLQNLVQSQDPLSEQAILAVGNIHPEGIVLVSEGDTPLILERAIGFGRVLYFAADPALAPLRNWDGMEDLYISLLSSTSGTPTWANGFTDWNSAGNALANIPGLTLPPVWLICGFLILYVIMIGPVNYFILRALKIREMAWVSVPIFTLLFTGAAFLIGFQIRGTRPIVTHLSILEVWPGEEMGISHGLVGVFSPQRAEYDFQMGSRLLAHPIPPTNFSDSPEDWFAYQEVDGFRVPAWQVDVGGIQGAVTSGRAAAPAFSHQLTFELAGNNTLRLGGTVTNQSDVRLENVHILGPSGSQFIGAFQPGETIHANFTYFQDKQSIPLVAGQFSPNPTIDTTMEDIFGTAFQFSLDDTAEIQRFNLLNSALGLSGSRGSGFYLLGWSDEALYASDLENERSQDAHTTLYIVHLVPALGEIEGLVRLPPSFFNWSVFQEPTLSGTVSPYDVYTPSGFGEYSLRFSLNQPIQFNKVVDLVLHLENFNAQGPVPFDVALWDHQAGSWQALEDPAWGANSIPSPDIFVGENGEIRLQIRNNSLAGGIVLQRSDFSLLVEK